jgi:hypothetical protein
MQEQAEAEYLELADRWRLGLATEDELQEAADFAAQFDDLDAPKDLPIYTDEHIGRIILFRCCARCYGHLVKYPAPERKWYALCPNCADAWHGAHISKRTAELIEQKALADYRDVINNPALADILPVQEKHSEADLLAELGYMP